MSPALHEVEWMGGCDAVARNYAAEYLEEMQELSDEEFGRLMRALLRYSSTGEEPALTGNERFYARRIMTREDKYQDSYDDLTAKRSEAGKKGAAARWNSGNGNASLPMADEGKYGKDKDKNKDKDKVYSLPSTDGRRRAVPAAQAERMRRDMETMMRVVQGGAAP